MDLPPSRCWLLLSRTFCHRLQAREPFFESPADHGVHVHEQTDSLGYEISIPEQAPRYGGVITLGLEGELRGVGGGKWFHIFQFDSDQVARTTFSDRCASFAYLIVAGPGGDGAGSGRRALVRFLHCP